MPFGNFAVKAAALLALSLLTQGSRAQEPQTLAVYTDDYPPYVLGDDLNAGLASRVVGLVLDDMGQPFIKKRANYAYAYLRVTTGALDLSYPYFQTAARSGKVLFSRPLFTVRNRLYFNRRFQRYSEVPPKGSNVRFGVVQGYSYGDELGALIPEQSAAFNSETSAVAALLAGDIDLLPMAEDVASAILERDFPDQRQLIRSIPQVGFASSLHLIAPKNADGQRFIEAFDATHARLEEAGALPQPSSDGAASSRNIGDVVDLVAAEGFPIVVGTAADQAEAQYAIPQGTRAIVLEWSAEIREPSPSVQLYATMVSHSRVIILNGPHVGKEMLIKSMHLSLAAK